MNGVEVFELFKHTDPRGWLLKAVKKEYTEGAAFGEIYVVGAPPGEVRANHYHKEATEWFAVLRGEAVLTLAGANDPGGEKQRLCMGGENRVCVKIPPGIAHAVRSVGDEEMILLAFADRAYDPAFPDTYACVID